MGAITMTELLTADSILYGAAGLGIGYTAGWLLKKTIMIVFKMLMVLAVIFVTALFYLEHIRVIAVNEKALDNLMNSGYNTLNNTIGTDALTNPLNHLVVGLGLPVTSGLGFGILLGWMKG